MAKDKSRNILRVVAQISVGIIFFIFIGGSMALYQNTLIKWWIPVSVTAAMALISAGLMHRRWRRLTGSDSTIFNFICHAAFSFSLFLFAFFAGNYFFADDDTKHTEEVVVEKRFREERHRTRRAGRRTVRTGEVYYEHYIDVRFSDGRIKTLHVSDKKSRSIRTGATLPLEVEMGYFGIPVIKSRNF